MKDPANRQQAICVEMAFCSVGGYTVPLGAPCNVEEVPGEPNFYRVFTPDSGTFRGCYKKDKFAVKKVGLKSRVKDKEFYVQKEVDGWRVYDGQARYLGFTGLSAFSDDEACENSALGCECGAKHTSFPEYHSDYCPLFGGVK